MSFSTLELLRESYARIIEETLREAEHDEWLAEELGRRWRAVTEQKLKSMEEEHVELRAATHGRRARSMLDSHATQQCKDGNAPALGPADAIRGSLKDAAAKSFSPMADAFFAEDFDLPEAPVPAVLDAVVARVSEGVQASHREVVGGSLANLPLPDYLVPRALRARKPGRPKTANSSEPEDVDPFDLAFDGSAGEHASLFGDDRFTRAAAMTALVPVENPAASVASRRKRTTARPAGSAADGGSDKAPRAKRSRRSGNAVSRLPAGARGPAAGGATRFERSQSAGHSEATAASEYADIFGDDQLTTAAATTALVPVESTAGSVASRRSRARSRRSPAANIKARAEVPRRRRKRKTARTEVPAAGGTARSERSRSAMPSEATHGSEYDGCFDHVIDRPIALSSPHPSSRMSRRSARSSPSPRHSAGLELPVAGEKEDPGANEVVHQVGSEDDCSEFDNEVAPNQLHANIVSLSRTKKRWQVELGHGLLVMGGVECLFASAQVDLEL